MFLYYLAAQREAEPAPGVLRRVERLEDAVQFALGNAPAGVGDPHLDRAVLVRRGHAQPPPLLHGLDRVLEDVDHRQPHQPAVGQHRREAIGEAGRQVDAATRTLRLEEPHEFAHRAIHVQGRPLHLRQARILEVVVRYLDEQLQFLEDQRDQFECLLRRAGPGLSQVFLEQLDVELDGCQWVAQLVGYLGGHGAHGGQALGLGQAGLEGLAASPGRLDPLAQFRVRSLGIREGIPAPRPAAAEPPGRHRPTSQDDHQGKHPDQIELRQRHDEARGNHYRRCNAPPTRQEPAVETERGKHAGSRPGGQTLRLAGEQPQKDCEQPGAEGHRRPSAPRRTSALACFCPLRD